MSLLDSPAPQERVAVRFACSGELAPILERLGLSLLVTTYQAGRVFCITAAGGKITLHPHEFTQPMGVAVSRDSIAVASRKQVWHLRAAPEFATNLLGRSRDGCYLARSAHFTGEILIHELAWGTSDLWLVNTLFSCLCTLDDRHSFVPRWRPKFIESLGSGDQCHLNGLAMFEGAPRYVTALGETDAPGGWRADKVKGGCVIDVLTGDSVIRGLAMPHSPRLHQGALLVLESGRGRLLHVDPLTQTATELVQLPGYPRGMALIGRYAFIGLSRIRESATFGGLPISEGGRELISGLAAVDLNARKLVGLVHFKTAVSEIFDVQILPFREPLLSGPNPEHDDSANLWLLPDAQTVMPYPPGAPRSSGIATPALADETSAEVGD